MRLHRTIRKGCGPVGVVMIVAYALMALYYARRIPKPQPEFYGQGSTLIASQWGKRSSTVCGPDGCTSSSDEGSWTIPSSPGDPWVYKRNGAEVGRVNQDGSTTGFVQSPPSWYPSDMPANVQARAKQFGQTKPIGEIAGSGEAGGGGTPIVGQLPPTGVDQSKLAEDKAKIPSGVSINGQPATESLVRDRLSDSAKAQGLKDYDSALRLVIVGHDTERKPFVTIAKPWADASEGKLLLQEYEDEDWQVKAHVNGAKSIPDYQSGKPFAYLQRPNGAVKAIMYTPSEVAQVIKQARPDIAPNFDAARARALTQTSNDWLIWASGGFIALMGLIGAVTSKDQQ